jgi:hypothetical protein
LERLKEREKLGALGVEGSILFKWKLNEICCENMHWIQVGQDTVQI